jgi:peptide/nickel transport system substrate-binding protein
MRRIGIASVLAVALSGCGAAVPVGEGAQALSASTLVVSFSDDMDSIDPAYAYYFPSWQMEFATCAKLLDYADVNGAAQLVPELATAMPDISADGTSYHFKVRSGFGFSTGEPVTAATIKQSYLRSMNVPQGPIKYTGYMKDLVSIAISGVQNDELTFTIRAPSGDFLHRLSLPFFCTLPSSVPAANAAVKGLLPPSAGPYYIASYVSPPRDGDGNIIAEGSLILRKNPYYGGSRPRNFDVIQYRLGVDPYQAVSLAQSGVIDYVADGAPPDLVTDILGSQYASELFLNPLLGYNYVAMNTSRPVFSDVNLRRAVNYAIDRSALGASFNESPNDNYLPPGIPGYNGVHLYPLAGPDPDTALSLMAGATPSVVLYANNRPRALHIASLLQNNLKQVGFNVTIQPQDDFYGAVGTRGAPFDLAIGGWLADYPDPSQFLNVLLDGNQIQANNNLDFSYFNDSVYNQELESAAKLVGSARYDRYSQLAVEAMDKSPLAVIGNFISSDFFSSRVGCQIYNSPYGMDLTALCQH